mgnify:CR=1 FL=1
MRRFSKGWKTVLPAPLSGNQRQRARRVAAPESPAMNVDEAKADLRSRMRALLAAIPPSERAAAGVAAAERLAALAAFRSARRVAIYLAMPREMPTAPLIKQCARDGRAMAVPAFDPASARYRMAEFDPRAPLRAAALGIREPADPRWIETDTLDLWIVPGLAFDARGGRLGRGGGWYDRLLFGATAPRIGWAFEDQVVAEVPRTARDERVDVIVTERRTIGPGVVRVEENESAGAALRQAPREKRTC